MLLIGIDDVHKGGLETGTANQEAVNVLLFGELPAVLFVDTPSIDDPRILSHFGVDGFR